MSSKSYAAKLQDSVRNTFESISNNETFPFESKLFNLIRNDLSGILNRRGLKSYSFDYRGALLSQLNFKEEHWDKRKFRDEVEVYLVDKEDEGEYAKSLSILGFNDQQIEFLYKVGKKLTKNE